ncbi:MAG: GrpB family protein [Saprospiraceae bacterium]
MMTKTKILIEDYSALWALTFQLLKSIYELHLNDLVIDIQHIGSTAVYGLAAKPIIDIDLIIADRNNLTSVIEKLSLLGYDHLGDLGITEREAFKRKSDKTPLDGSSRTWHEHNLYVCPSDSISLKNHLALRDFLLTHPEKAKEYGELKKRLVSENPYDMDLYVERKTPFIIAILKDLGFSVIALDNIARENKVLKEKNGSL